MSFCNQVLVHNFKLHQSRCHITSNCVHYMLDYLNLFFYAICSTKGVGATAPDFSKARELDDGLTVPLGKPKKNSGIKVFLFQQRSFGLSLLTMTMVYYMIA